MVVTDLGISWVNNKRIKHYFPSKPECENVLQPDPRRNDGCHIITRELFKRQYTEKNVTVIYFPCLQYTEQRFETTSRRLQSRGGFIPIDASGSVSFTGNFSNKQVG